VAQPAQNIKMSMATLETSHPRLLRPGAATQLKIPQATSAISHSSMTREPLPGKDTTAPGGASNEAFVVTVTLNGA
jgi:hypothetical protein